jgi:lauroyl/myristoyl acyltransferase
VDRAVAGILGDFSINATAKDKLEKWANEDNGIIFMTAHTGYWQIAPYALIEYVKKPVTILGHFEEEDVDKKIYEHQGTLPPFQFVTAKDGYLGPVKLITLLCNGGILCTTGDRVIDYDKAVLETTFLGHAIKISYLPFRLASATGAAVVFAFARRVNSGHGELCIEDGLRVPGSLGKNPEEYRPYVQQYITALEKFVDEYPYQFFNFYDMWE